MASCKFLFDVIVTHLEVLTVNIKDPAKLQIIANFNKNKIPLTASRINVSEFKPGAELEIKDVPKKLRTNIEECGMPIVVLYNNKAIGVGQITFPPVILDQMQEEMSDVIHVDRCILEKDGEVIGSLEMQCRLVIKCDEPLPGENICHRNLDKSIKQDDIMFIMSESQRCPNSCDPCQDALEPEEGDDNLKLDMQLYRSSNAGRLRPAETLIHSSVDNSICSKLKNMAQECEELIDSIAKSFGHPKPLKSPCQRPDDQNGSYSIPCQYFQEDNKPSRSIGPCFSYLPARQCESPDFCDPALIPVQITDFHKPSIKPARYCPICLTNMSWLPKFAVCPKCGIKPMPVIEERHKKEKLTSEKIIQEFLGESKDSFNDYCKDPCDITHNDDGPECRCTCKQGKLCTHCRIRNLCAEIFQASKNEKECPRAKPKSSEDFCVLKDDSEECSPHLARVFSELRDLYNNKGTKECLSSMSLKTKSAVKQSQCAISRTVHKPTERKAPVLGVGHKQCVKRKSFVSRYHGWAWGLREEASLNGWRPGCVRKSVNRIMKFFFQYSTENNAFNKCKEQKSENEEENQRQSTLYVCKKDGEIVVTLRALNNANMQMKPIVFSLVKSDLAVALREIKTKLKDKGFRKCTCHKTLMMCDCRNILEKKHLELALQKECKRRGMENCMEHLVLTDTSESEMEFEFGVSPSAAMAKPCPLRCRTFNNGSQYNKKYLIVPPKYPVKLDPYWRAYDCAAGDRYTGTAFGRPGEAVFEDGVFGHEGGGPHGPSATLGGKVKPKGVLWSSPGGPMRGGGRVGPGIGGGLAGRGGPGAKGKSGVGAEAVGVKSAPIPVRMPKRHIEAVKQAIKSEKDAIKNEIARKKKGIDLMEYLMGHGAVRRPWDPNNRQPKEPILSGPVLDPDGLSDAQRKRRALQQMCVPPLDSMPRLGKSFDPCQCYNSCAIQCCYPCCYYCEVS